MTNRRQPWDFDPFAFNGNARAPYDLSQEYGAAMEAFHDALRPAPPSDPR